MTAKNSKKNAIPCATVPEGTVVRREGDYILVQSGHDGTWYKLDAPPETCCPITNLDKSVKIARQVGNKVVIGGNWFVLVPPAIVRRRFEVIQKVPHNVVWENKKCKLVQYKRDNSYEWVVTQQQPVAVKQPELVLA